MNAGSLKGTDKQRIVMEQMRLRDKAVKTMTRFEG
jgi:hypothetical protein